jgi:hypothetical protein
LVSASLTACAAAGRPSRAPIECPRERLARATRYDSTNWRALEGAFRIIEVDTVNGRVTEVNLLRLRPLDSAAKAQYTPPFKRLGRGGVELDSTPRRMPVLAGAARVMADEPLVSNWVAYASGDLGQACPPSSLCMDWSPTSYFVTHVSAKGLFGTWDNPMVGIVRLYDQKKKRELPAPAGYFCAIRRTE